MSAADTYSSRWWGTACAAALFAGGWAAGWAHARRGEGARRARQDAAYRALSAALGAVRCEHRQQAEDLAEARARLASLASALDQSSIEHPSNISLGIESFTVHGEEEGEREDGAGSDEFDDDEEDEDEDEEEDNDAGVDLSTFRTPCRRRHAPRHVKAASPVRMSSSEPLFDATNMRG